MCAYSLLLWRSYIIPWNLWWQNSRCFNIFHCKLHQNHIFWKRTCVIWDDSLSFEVSHLHNFHWINQTSINYLNLKFTCCVDIKSSFFGNASMDEMETQRLVINGWEEEQVVLGSILGLEMGINGASLAWTVSTTCAIIDH